MPVVPGTIQTVEDCAAWIYEHDGRIDAWWESQREHNARVTTSATACQSAMQGQIGTINTKIDEMQRTIYKATGAAMLGGGFIGAVVTVTVAFIQRG